MIPWSPLPPSQWQLTTEPERHISQPPEERLPCINLLPQPRMWLNNNSHMFLAITKQRRQRLRLLHTHLARMALLTLHQQPLIRETKSLCCHFLLFFFSFFAFFDWTFFRLAYSEFYFFFSFLFKECFLVKTLVVVVFNCLLSRNKAEGIERGRTKKEKE